MNNAPKGMRLHMGLFGRRNVGKSSLLNAITRQHVSIVSDQAGTTTDPVEKPMEILPLGPVLFIDTAGLDDAGALGDLRMVQTRRVFERTDLGLIVTDGIWGEYEETIRKALQDSETPILAVFNKSDLAAPSQQTLDLVSRKGIPCVQVSATSGAGLESLRQAMFDHAPDTFMEEPTILGDLVGAGELAVLVVPIDKEAPKGRLILPQVQAIRDLLDSDAMTMIVKERELKIALEACSQKPKLVVTDSQAFLKVAADTPRDIPMTSFSILFARFKGDLVVQTQGVRAIDGLKAGDRILIAEACSHRPLCEDIGRVKIPRWLTQFVGGKLEFDVVQGRDFPDDLSPYKLVIHCGACMWNRKAMLSRLARCKAAGVPITNYGLAIAHSLGILDRALGPFPAALDVYRKGSGP
ncbi:MAG: [FeFe] hydrogenase H-cluster maturation GTPase HydF [Alphaproteobacteria bacterium]|nr:[FeFe] hydrogenase H-cluster maturation GTPase HydF [Alphaproteobacteria bacterium]